MENDIANGVTIAETLDLEPDVPATKVEAQLPATTENNSVVEEDYNLIRENLKRLLETGNTAIDELHTIASAAQSPRAYEVLTELLNSMGQINKDLLGLSKTKKEINSTPVRSPANAPGMTNFFIGSTKDLQDLIAANAKDVTDEAEEK